MAERRRRSPAERPRDVPVGAALGAAKPPVSALPYATRRQLVAVGRARPEVLVAAFPLASGGEVLFQLLDEGELRRGGVYLLPAGGREARAPRFDELFREVAFRAREPGRARALGRLVERARLWARATRPRLSPVVLRRLGRLGAAAGRLDAGQQASGLAADALVLSLALVFASEEERYQRPRYKGCDLAAERVMELLRIGSRPGEAAAP